MIGHPAKADKFLEDKPYAKWHDETLWFVRSKRDKASKALPEWESLRQAASDIKATTCSSSLSNKPQPKAFTFTGLKTPKSTIRSFTEF